MGNIHQPKHGNGNRQHHTNDGNCEQYVKKNRLESSMRSKYMICYAPPKKNEIALMIFSKWIFIFIVLLILGFFNGYLAAISLLLSLTAYSHAIDHDANMHFNHIMLETNNSYQHPLIYLE
jgi:hypothetical protein